MEPGGYGHRLVVRMEFGDFSMLFTGDAETDQRQWLMERHPGLLRRFAPTKPRTEHIVEGPSGCRLL
jgi:hypothetical protein